MCLNTEPKLPENTHTQYYLSLFCRRCCDSACWSSIAAEEEKGEMRGSPPWLSCFPICVTHSHTNTHKALYSVRSSSSSIQSLAGWQGWLTQAVTLPPHWGGESGREEREGEKWAHSRGDGEMEGVRRTNARREGGDALRWEEKKREEKRWCGGREETVGMAKFRTSIFGVKHGIVVDRRDSSVRSGG